MPVLRSMLDATMKTRLFFTPFDLSKYAAVAVVTAFVGFRAGYVSVTNLGAVFFFDGDVAAVEPPVALVAETVGTVDLFVAGVVAVTLAAFVSAVAEFVLIDVLRTDEEHVGRYARERLDEGTRLFVFRSVATALFFAPAFGVALLVGRAPDSVVTTAVFAALVFGIVVSLANGFTTDFVAPVMVVRGCSVSEGWRVFWHVLAREPVAFFGYAVARSVGNLVVAVGATVAALAVAAFYALPVAGLSVALGLTSEGYGLSPEMLVTTVAGFVLLVVVLVFYVVLVVASVAVLVQLPVRLFFRSWSLYFLGEIDDEYRMLEKPDEGVLEPLGSYLSYLWRS